MISTAMQAIQVAIEMEKRAIRTYQQGICVMESRNPELAGMMKEIIQDEWQHLAKFYAIRREELEGRELSKTELATAQAYAAKALFPEGLLDIMRKGDKQSRAALLQFAISGELGAIEFYSDAADAFSDTPAANIFLQIAAEEQQHAQALYARAKK